MTMALPFRQKAMVKNTESKLFKCTCLPLNKRTLITYLIFTQMPGHIMVYILHIL